MRRTDFRFDRIISNSCHQYLGDTQLKSKTKVLPAGVLSESRNFKSDLGIMGIMETRMKIRAKSFTFQQTRQFLPR